MLARRLRRPALAHPLALAACLLMAMAAAWPLATAHAAADPTLTLDPDRASCTDRIVVRGRNFPPGQAIALIAFLPGGGRAGVIGRATVPADGTFTIGVEVREFAGPCAGETALPNGTRFIINAVIDQGSSLGGPLATTTFTLASSSPRPPGLPNTGGGAQGRTAPPTAPLAAAGVLAALGGCLLGYGRHRRRARRT